MAHWNLNNIFMFTPRVRPKVGLFAMLRWTTRRVNLTHCPSLFKPSAFLYQPVDLSMGDMPVEVYGRPWLFFCLCLRRFQNLACHRRHRLRVVIISKREDSCREKPGTNEKAVNDDIHVEFHRAEDNDLWNTGIGVTPSSCIVVFLGLK